MQWLGLILLGLLVGGLSGMLGVGGGIVLVPALILAFGFSQTEAQGTSLAVLVPPIGLFAALAYYRHGMVQLPVVGWIVVGFVVGAYLGALAVPYLPARVLQWGFGLLLLFTGIQFLISDPGRHKHAALPAAIATAILWAATLIYRRKKAQPPPEGPTLPEYHI
jgi:uncharacterized membrane protein YfcA